MSHTMRGFSGVQILVAMVALAAVSLVAAPKYKSYVARAKLTEAFNLAGASKPKIIEYFTVNNRLPNNADEANALRAETVSPPEFVRSMEVDHRDSDHELAIKVYLKTGVVPNDTGGEQYVFIAADRSPDNRAQILWTCGASGIDAELLPKECQL